MQRRIFRCKPFRSIVCTSSSVEQYPRLIDRASLPAKLNQVVIKLQRITLWQVFEGTVALRHSMRRSKACPMRGTQCTLLGSAMNENTAVISGSFHCNCWPGIWFTVKPQTIAPSSSLCKVAGACNTFLKLMLLAFTIFANR